jgi:uncharacterized membrane protein YeaQ/YmgE (transglycosylase-associated protein family)
MDLIVYLILVAVQGLIIGGLARLALPGPDPMGLGQTILVGIAGAFLGGLVSLLLFSDAVGGGFFISFVFAVGIVYLIRRRRGQGLMSTRRDPHQTRF